MTADPFSYLFELEHFGIKFGLENIRAIVTELGHPERAFQSAHVAGTNGKGSVTAMVDAALCAAGHRTARYTSPHLVDLTERFAVAGHTVQRDALANAVLTVKQAIDALVSRGSLRAQPTFFEVTTAAAFELFRQLSVKVATFEVGLGGRLDATNVLSPIVCAITSIALDHEHYLGATLTEIAAEKAGIIKSGVPVVVGDLGDESMRVMVRTAERCGAPLIRASENCTVVAGGTSAFGTYSVRLRTPARDYGVIRLGLRGAHQIGNALVAVRVLETLDAAGIGVPREAVVSGLESVRWPGRLELVRVDETRDVLLDAAHNPAGAATLAAFLHSETEKRPLVFSAMRDKDFVSMLRVLAPEVDAIILTRASQARAADPHELAAVVRAFAPSLAVEVETSPRDALAAAWRRRPHIAVAGSIFLLGDVIRELGAS